MPDVSARDMADALADKVSKAEVDYSEGLPNSHCGPVSKWPSGVCANFYQPSGCRLVRGVIKHEMWCKLWEARDTDG